MANEQRTLTANFTANSSGFAKGTSEAIQHLRELNTELAQVKQNVKTTNAEIRGYEKQLEALKKATNNGEDATEEQRKEMQKLEDAIAKCTVELGSYQTEQQRLQSSIRAANKQIDDQGQAVDKTADKFKKFGAAIAGAGTAIVGAGTAVAAGITFAVTKASEMQTAVNDLTIATGASADEAAKYKQTIEAVYGDGFGDDLKDVSDSVAQIKRNLKDLNNTELTDVTESALALRGAFGYDVSESSRAARALQQNFNISAKDAYSYIYSGAQSGLDYAGDFLDSISEYSVQFSKMGLSVEEMFAIFYEGAENGAWNIDKVGDAVKEMAIRVIDGSKSTQEGFALINMSADEMAQKFAQGGETARQAFDDTLEAIKSLEDPVKQDAAGVALLGTMWEDLGKDVVLSFASIEESSFKASEALENVLNSKDNNTERQAASLKREIELIIMDIGTELLPMANEMISDVKDELPEITDEIKGTASAVGDVIGKLWEVREIIGAVIAGAVTYKTGTAIVSTIKDTINAVNGLKSATQSATTAQTALNAATKANPAVLIFSAATAALVVLIPKMIELYEAADICNDEYNRLKQQTEELAKEAEDYKSAASGVDDIAEGYSRITEEVTDLTERETALRDLQSDLIDQYGIQASGIDLVNGSYQEQLVLLGNLKTANEELYTSTIQSRYDAAKLAEEAVFSIDTNIENSDLANVINKWIYENLKTSGYSQYSGDYDALAAGGAFGSDVLHFSGSYAARSADLKALYDYVGTLIGHSGGVYDNELKSFRASLSAGWSEMDTQDRQLQSYAEALGLVYHNPSTTHNSAEYYEEIGKANLKAQQAKAAETKAASERSYDELKTEYDKEKQLADDMYGVGEISAREYYDKLTSLRDHYLEAQSHEWYVATKEIKSVYAQLMKDMGDATDDSADRITNALGEVKTAYQDTLEAIDRELERRNREKQDEELNRQINAVTARLAYEQIDEYSRIALEKQLEELQEKREDIDFERNINDSKAQLEAAYNATQGLIGTVPKYDPEEWAAVLSSAFDQITEGYLPKASAKDQAEASRVYNVVINAENKTTSQIVAEVKRAIASGSI